MPGPLTTAPPTAVPNAMPVLKEAGSIELASVSALGWRLVAVSINIEMHGTETMYMRRPMNSTITSAHGMLGPRAHSAASATARSGKVTRRPLMPKRESTTPEARLLTRQTPPYAMSTALAATGVMPRMPSRYGVM